MIRRLLTARTDWDRTAVAEGGQSVSYRELAQKVVALQKLLPGERDRPAAILLPNGSAYVAAFFGTVLSGLTAFPLNASMTAHEVLPLLAQASVRTVITADRYRPYFASLGEGEAAGPRVVYWEDLPARGGGALPEAVPVAADEPMALLSTSGTTGKAKIIQLSERNVEAAVLGYDDKMDYTGIAKPRFILGAPFSSAYGVMVLSSCLLRAFPVIPLGEGFALDGFYRTVEAQRATHYEGSASVALMMERMAGRPIPYDISSLRYMAFGGSKVSAQTVTRLLAAFPGVEFYQGYGMTEASPLITKRPRKPGSAGQPIKGVTVAVEAEGAITRAPYVKGEVVVKGPNIMLGYYNNEEETKRTIRNGFLYTGDIGYLDADGELYICGRKKNIIIVRGFTVHPEEVEECIAGSPLAKDCFVYGKADGPENEIICADVVPATPQVRPEDIRAYCRERLAEYKQPQVLRLCGEIGKTASGKTERAKGTGQ